MQVHVSVYATGVHVFASLCLPHKCGVDLRGERVIFKRRDLTEDVGEEQVDKGDGDGRKILEEQT